MYAGRSGGLVGAAEAGPGQVLQLVEDKAGWTNDTVRILSGPEPANPELVAEMSFSLPSVDSQINR